jgi:hypothetical protein
MSLTHCDAVSLLVVSARVLLSRVPGIIRLTEAQFPRIQAELVSRDE